MFVRLVNFYSSWEREGGAQVQGPYGDGWSGCITICFKCIVCSVLIDGQTDGWMDGWMEGGILCLFVGG